MNEKIYTSLAMLFCALMAIGNLTCQKFVSLDLSSYKFELSAGVVLYPISFLITGLIVEFYGKDKANFCITISILINIILAIIIAFLDFLPATNWSKINDDTFHRIFGFYGLTFACSMGAFYISQSVDIYLYSWIKNKTNGRYLWLRSNVSIFFSLLLDTTIVISLMVIFGMIPFEQIQSLIMDSYLWKLLFTICSTPVFYLCVWWIRKYFIQGDN